MRRTLETPQSLQGNLLNDWHHALDRPSSGLTNLRDSALAGRVFLDLINEPDGINVR